MGLVNWFKKPLGEFGRDEERELNYFPFQNNEKWKFWLYRIMQENTGLFLIISDYYLNELRNSINEKLSEDSNISNNMKYKRDFNSQPMRTVQVQERPIFEQKSTKNSNKNN